MPSKSKVAYHLSDIDKVAFVLGNIRNHYDGTDGAVEIALVVHGPALAAFKTGACRVLIATDIAARGIDVEAVSHVINLDLPNVPESYVHRIGRTARAGAEGVAIAFCAGDERSLLKDIERTIRQSIPVKQHALGKSNLPPAEHEAKRCGPCGGEEVLGQIFAHDHALKLVRHVGDGRNDEFRHAQCRRQELPDAERDPSDEDHRDRLQVCGIDPRRRRRSARSAISDR